MRNIAEIIEDDRKGKQLSQTESRIAMAYIQGKYDAVRELKICNNLNTMEVFDKIRAEISKSWHKHPKNRYEERLKDQALKDVQIIDKYRGMIK